MRRLALELPTVLQFNASYAVLFHKGGVTQLKNIDDPDKYLPICFPPGEFSHRIWVLIDINPNLPQPAPAFRYNSYFFAVSSISPGSMNTEWLDKLYEKRFYMKPWSNLEVIQGYVDLPFGGPQRSLSVVVISSVVRSAQNVNSSICSISMARLPEPWLTMAPTLNST